jgi:hypothetical protein
LDILEQKVATRKTWRYNPKKPKEAKPEVPEELKQYMKEKGDEIVETIFKPEYLSPASDEKEINQLVDIFTKWHRNNFYFCVKYKFPPNVNRTFFENKFVKFEYLGDDQFQYSYMRHTGKWYPTSVMAVEDCLKQVALEVPF